MGGIREVGFGNDDFQNPKVLSPVDSIGQQLINLFLMEPGTLPSMPHIGIGIRNYMTYILEDELDEDELKSKIYAQAKELLPYLDLGEISLTSFELDGSGVLYIAVPITISDETLLIAFVQNDISSSVLYDFKIESNGFV